MAKSNTSQKIKIANARLAFVSLDKAKPYEAGQKDYFSFDVLLDPSIPEHLAAYKLVVTEGRRLAKEEYGSDEGIKNKCWGKGDDRKRAGTNDVYAGYAGMYYVKLKAHADRNAVGAEHFGFVADRSGKGIAPGNPQWVYGGCYANVSCTLWALSSKSKNIRHGKSVGGNLIAVQFVRDGEAFGGAGPVRMDEEFEPLPESDAAASASGTGTAVAEDDADF